MVFVSLDARTIAVRLTLLERVFALHGSISVPREAIRSATAVPDGLAAVRGIRAPGLGIPGWVKFGTWRRRGTRTFALVKGRGPALHLQMSDGPIAEVLVSTSDADTLANRLSTAISGADQ